MRSGHRRAAPGLGARLIRGRWSCLAGSAVAVALAATGASAVAGLGDEDLPPGADLRLGFVSGYLQDRVQRIAFPPGGELYVAAGTRRMAVFSTADGGPLGALPTPKGKQVLDATLMDAGAAVLAVVGSRAVVLSRDDGWEQRAFGGDDLWAEVARLSPDGKRVAVGGRRAQLQDDERVTLVRVFERESGRVLRELEMAGRGVGGIAFSPSGDALAVASRDRFLRVFDLATGREALRVGGRVLDPAVVESEEDRLDPERVKLEFVGVEFLPGGDEILGLTLRHSLSRWRRRDGALLQKVEAAAPSEGAAARLPVTRRRVGMDFFALSPDGVRVLTYSQDLELYNLSSREVEHVLPFPAGSPTAASFTPDGRSVVVGGSRGVCFRYLVDTGEIVGRDKEVRGAVVSLALRPGAGEVLAGDLRYLRRWRTSDGYPVGQAMDHGAPVDVLAASPDGSRAFTGGGSPGGKIWSLGGDRLEVAPELGGDDPAGAYFSGPAQLVVVGRSGRARVFTPPDPAPVDGFSTGEGALAVARAPSGRTLAVVGVDGLRIVDLETRRVQAVHAFTGSPAGMAFSPDGETVAVGMAGQDVVLRYDVRAGPLDSLVLRKAGEDIPTRHLGDQRAGTWDVAFTPGGERLVARSAGRALQVWSHPEGRRVGHVHGSVRNALTGLCRAGSGERVISAAGKVAYRWRLEVAR